jgi:tetratricopeptide (TPR) repeat protein
LARVGISTGSVIINHADGDYYGKNAVGVCINKASRLQSITEEGSATVCSVTRRLVGRMFDFEPIGAQALKGFGTPETVHRLKQRRRQPVSRFEALRGGTARALVGRDAEMGDLLARLEAASRGSGSAVVIRGEPGIGKSRLLDAFRQHEAVETSRVVVLQCSPTHRNTTLHPVREYLEWVAGTRAEDGPEARRGKLERLFTTAWSTSREQLTLLLDVLVPVAGEAEGTGEAAAENIDLSVPLKRRMVFKALSEKIFAIGMPSRPLVCVFEDVHWIDPSSVELLRVLIEDADAHAALIVVTTRPEGPFVNGAERAARIDLAGLDEAHCLALARQACAAAGIGAEAIEAIVRKSEGVPLYVEEYAQMLADTGRGRGGEEGVPITLQGLVQGKIDRLNPDARHLAQAGATIGREFEPEIAAAIAGLSSDTTWKVAVALETADLARRKTKKSSGRVKLIFKHALVQDAVYHSLNRSQRSRLHGALADQLLALSDSRPIADEELAEHLYRAGRLAASVDRRFAAALAAAGVGSAAEALAHLEKGLEAVAEMPAGAERDRLELQLRAVQGPTLMVTRGPGNPDFGNVEARALELLRKLGVRDNLVPVIYNAALHAWASGNLAEADALTDEMFELLETAPADDVYLAAHTMRGLVAWHRGDNEAALEHLTRTVQRYDPARHTRLYKLFLKDFGVFGRFYRALTLTLLGRLAEGAEEARRTQEAARAIRFPHEYGFSLLANYLCAMLRGDVETAAAFSAECKTYATEQGFPEFIAMSMVCAGWVASGRGDVEAGVDEMERGAAFWAKTGFEPWQALFAAMIAQACVDAGRLERAAELIDLHEARIAAMGEAQFVPVLTAARAALLEARGDGARAEAQRAHGRAAATARNARLWLDAPQPLVARRS